MDYINDKSRIYFVIDVVNWRGMVQPLISDFGSKEELESEDGIVGSNYESIQKFVDEYQPGFFYLFYFDYHWGRTNLPFVRNFHRNSEVLQLGFKN